MIIVNAKVVFLNILDNIVEHLFILEHTINGN